MNNCISSDLKTQKDCPNFDGTKRTDGNDLCFNFRDFRGGFFICDRVGDTKDISPKKLSD